MTGPRFVYRVAGATGYYVDVDGDEIGLVERVHPSHASGRGIWRWRSPGGGAWGSRSTRQKAALDLWDLASRPGGRKKEVTRMLLIRNHEGREFAVVFEPDRAEKPQVAFHDRTYRDREGFDPELGQMVSRYNVDTILGEDGYGRAEGGLCLHGGEPAWTIDDAAMREVRGYLRGKLDR